MSQLTYSTQKSRGLEGAIADDGIRDFSTRACEDAKIEFGRVVVRGTTDTQCKNPTSTNQKVIGLSVFEYKEENADKTNSYNQYEAVNIMREGSMLVKPVGTVTDGANAYFYHTTVSSKAAGMLTVSGAANSSILTGGKYESSKDTEGFSVLRFKA